MPGRGGWRRELAAAFAVSLAQLVGCQTNSEYVEAELRHQCKQVRVLEERVANKDAEIETLKSTVSSYQAGYVKPADAPEAIYRETAVSKLSLALATGGKDADLDGRDDGVQVVLTPLDYDGDAFKCPGTAVVKLYERLPTGVKRELSETTFVPDRLRTLWRSTLVGQGYHMVIPWSPPPRENKLRTVVAFQTLDGRKFEVEKDFEVALDVTRAARKPGAVLEPDAERPDRAKPEAAKPSENGAPEPKPDPMPEPPPLKSDGNVERAFVPAETPAEVKAMRSSEVEIIKLPTPKSVPAGEETSQAPGRDLPGELPSQLAGAPLPATTSAAQPAIVRVGATSPTSWPTYRWNDLVKRNNFFATERAHAPAAQ